MSTVEMGVTCWRFIKYLECTVSGQYSAIQVRTVATFYHLNSLILKALRSADQEFQALTEYYSQHNKIKIIFPDTFRLAHVTSSPC